MAATDARHTGDEACPERNHQRRKRSHSDCPRSPAPDVILMLRKVQISAETVEKPFSIVNGWFWGVLMTPRNCEIVDCGAFCEVIFFCICSKNLLGDFFDSLAMNVAFLNLRKVII